MPSARGIGALFAMCAVQDSLCFRQQIKREINVSSTGGSPHWPGSCKSSDYADDALYSVLKNNDLTGKIFVLTGADGNIAGEVGKTLAKRNASIILACRTPAKCEARRKEIMGVRVVSNGSLEIEQLDLSDRANTLAFANRILVKHSQIDVLINSAGTYATGMSKKDNLSIAMEVNLLGPVFLAHLLLPSLRGGDGRTPGRVVNVAAATYGFTLAANTTVADLAELCTNERPDSNFRTAKFLLTHHALELAKREPTVAAFALNPGVAIEEGALPIWLKNLVKRYGYTDWVYKMLPKELQKFVKACNTNLKGYASCPQSLAQAASVVVAAAAWPGIEPYSGSYLDFETSPLPPDAPQVYGPWQQSDPTCVPRKPPPMEARLRSAWYDEMLRLMGVGSEGALTS